MVKKRKNKRHLHKKTTIPLSPFLLSHCSLEPFPTRSPDLQFFRGSAAAPLSVVARLLLPHSNSPPVWLLLPPSRSPQRVSSLRHTPLGGAARILGFGEYRRRHDYWRGHGYRRRRGSSSLRPALMRTPLRHIQRKERRRSSMGVQFIFLMAEAQSN